MSAAVEGKPAVRIKVIAYLAGCEIVTLDTAVESVSQPAGIALQCSGRDFDAWADFAGFDQIRSVGGCPVTYIAFWSQMFFGISDGPVVTIPVGIAVPDRDGRFEVQLPDYARQNGLGDGVFQFVLRQGSNRDAAITLRPGLEAGKMGGLKECSSHPSHISFLAENIDIPIRSNRLERYCAMLALA